MLGIRSPEELPHLRGIPLRANDRSDEAQATLERQWREFWAMTVEPQAHPSPVPLQLVDGFDMVLALLLIFGGILAIGRSVFGSGPPSV